MKSIWITYAWKDNEDQDLEYIAQTLRDKGLEVRYDRTQLLVGRRLWEQIEEQIRDPNLGAWAILTTENSLNSEPCMEELAYALDRALRTRGQAFPIIGLFSGPIADEVIPSALATRLYVDLTQNDWADRIAQSLSAEKTSSPTSRVPDHRVNTLSVDPIVVEFHPMAGVWAQFFAAGPPSEIEGRIQILPGTRGHIAQAGMVSGDDLTLADGLKGFRMSMPVNANTSAQVWLPSWPSMLRYGYLKDSGWEYWTWDKPGPGTGEYTRFFPPPS